MSNEPIIAYCVKCREKREMAAPDAVYTANGTPGTRGSCSVCGTTMFKMGRTAAHADLPEPEVTVRPGRRSKNKKGAKAGRGRTGKLVIVESPAKARTIGKFLGKGYTVKASVGHIRDLLRSQLSVDVENNFAPKYRVPNEKRPLLKELKKDAAAAAEIYLATDADREGEAIAWHLMEAAEMDPERTKRVVFHEITKDAIAEAFAHPREIDLNRVNAQQARRILDRLVGYKISPLLWQRVRSRTSAGRVQSVALRLICEREDGIDDFVPREYWTVETVLNKRTPELQAEQRRFVARLHGRDGETIELVDEATTQKVLTELRVQSFQIEQVKRGQRRRKSLAPFITSTLQQEASRRLGFNTRKTMRIAQQLYEGIDLGEGETVGLITYMRTDSTNVSLQAQSEARKLITTQYGEEYLPEEAPKHKTSSKKAQEAHEAIRPSDLWRLPDEVRSYLSRDQYRLYNLIWLRFIASQMAPALYETIRAIIHAGLYELRASGSRLRFQGFLLVYEETKDEDSAVDDSLDGLLPELTEGELLDLEKVLPEQHFTQPPPRYTEASLVKTLEEFGIGRPSTYAPIISTIQERGYVERVDKRLYPTELGKIVNELLVRHFPDIVNVEFTANMEENLDRIAWNEQAWVPILQEFYAPFEQAVQEAEERMPKVEVAEMIGEKCELCSHDLIVKYGRFGKFIACSNFPECRYTRPFVKKIGVKCPKDGAEVVERKTKKGRIFYGCSNYPECDWTSWKQPLPTPCPNCQGLLVVQNKRTAQCTVCEERFDLDELPAPAEKEAEAAQDKLPQAV